MQVTRAADNAGTHQQATIHHRAVPCQPLTRASFPRVSPMDERLAQTCFSLGLLGRRKPPTAQIPIPKITRNPTRAIPPAALHHHYNSLYNSVRLIYHLIT